MQGQVVGSLIAAGFGMVYVVLNTSSLPPGIQWSLRAVATTGLLAVLVGAYRRVAGSRPARVPAGRPAFGRTYWLVVSLEAGLIIGGIRVLAGPLATPEAGVAWVSLVVGVHFFALARLFNQSFFHWLGAAISLCGGLALILAFTGTGQHLVALTGGVVPGLLLLASGVWGVQRSAAATEPSPPRRVTEARHEGGPT